MFLELFPSQKFVVLQDLLHFDFEFVDSLEVLCRIPHFLSVLYKFLDMLVLILAHFLKSLDLCFEILDL